MRSVGLGSGKQVVYVSDPSQISTFFSQYPSLPSAKAIEEYNNDQKAAREGVDSWVASQLAREANDVPSYDTSAYLEERNALIEGRIYMLEQQLIGTGRKKGITDEMRQSLDDTFRLMMEEMKYSMKGMREANPGLYMTRLENFYQQLESKKMLPEGEGVRMADEHERIAENFVRNVVWKQHGIDPEIFEQHGTSKRRDIKRGGR